MSCEEGIELSASWVCCSSDSGLSSGLACWMLIPWRKSWIRAGKYKRAVHSTSGSRDGESLWIRMGCEFHAPNYTGRNSAWGIRFHLIWLPLSLPKISAWVQFFWKQEIISCLFSSFLGWQNNSLYASIAQYTVFLQACHNTTPRWKWSSRNATSTL